MTRLRWHQESGIDYLAGVQQVVLYFKNHAVVWNGAISIALPAESEFDTVVYEGTVIFNVPGLEIASFSIEAFAYPEELDTEECVGMSFKTTTKKGLETHIIYGPRFSEPEMQRSSISKEIDPTIFSFEFSGTPIPVRGMAPTAHVYVNNAGAPSEWFDDVVESILYGNDSQDASLPDLNIMIESFQELGNNQHLLIIDHHDGTWSAVGKDELFDFPTEDSFGIEAESAVYLNPNTYTVESY